MIEIQRARGIGAVIALAAFLGACGDDGVDVQLDAISHDDVTGSYSAVVLTTTDGATIDQLARGTTLDITLHADGTTTGRLFVPDGGEDGGDLDADLTGTFAFDESSSEVSFEQSADTFVRDMTLSATRSDGVVQLEGERTFGSTTVRVVLR